MGDDFQLAVHSFQAITRLGHQETEELIPHWKYFS
jgi:hypothetical protein